MNKTRCSIIVPVYNDENFIIRALDSIPKRKDIEIIVIDDGSTDDTWNKLMQYRETHDIVLLYNQENKGVAYTVNRGYDCVKGEYVVLLGSDDYFYTRNFVKAMDKLDGTDFVFFQTSNNYGMVELNEHNKCGSFKFMRREFIKDYRNEEQRIAGEDYNMWNKMIKANPTIKELNITVKHYNYPREGSLNWQLNNGMINLETGEKK